MKIDRFEEIHAWQKARELCNLIYNQFKEHRDFSFKNQIERASISIMNNIAEGFERKSNNELRLFLYYAKGSCGEVRSMLYFAQDQSIINIETAEILRDKAEHISRMLANFIKTL